MADPPRAPFNKASELTVGERIRRLPQQQQDAIKERYKQLREERRQDESAALAREPENTERDYQKILTLKTQQRPAPGQAPPSYEELRRQAREQADKNSHNRIAGRAALWDQQEVGQITGMVKNFEQENARPPCDPQREEKITAIIEARKARDLTRRFDRER